MEKQGANRDGGASPVAPGDERSGRRFSRRQALGRMSVAAGAGAAAWVVPEILTAKPAAGATMSAINGTNNGSSPGTSASTTGNTGPGTGTGSGSTPATLASKTTPASTGTLAFTGVDIKRDAEMGAALIAGGWAMHHWASRTPKPAVEAATELPEAGSQADPI